MTKENRRRDRIFLAAESLFALHGFNGVSIRDISKKAEVNSALVQYYFSSKESLYRAIFEQRYRSVTDERLAEIERVRPERNKKKWLHALVRVWVFPSLLLTRKRGGARFIQLLAREYYDPESEQRGIIKAYFDPSAQVFTGKLRELFPQASAADIAYAYQSMITLLLTLGLGGRQANRLAEGEPPKTLEQRAAFIVDFAASGMYALLSVPAQHVPSP